MHSAIAPTGHRANLDVRVGAPVPLVVLDRVEAEREAAAEYLLAAKRQRVIAQGAQIADDSFHDDVRLPDRWCDYRHTGTCMPVFLPFTRANIVSAEFQICVDYVAVAETQEDVNSVSLSCFHGKTLRASFLRLHPV